MPSNFGQGNFGRGGVAGLGVGRAPVNTITVVRRKPIRWILSGITKDYLGVALGGCTLECFLSVPTGRATLLNPTNVVQDGEPKGRFVNSTISNSVTGAYRLEVNANPKNQYNIDAYLIGSPDRAGTTVNTLVGNLETDQ